MLLLNLAYGITPRVSVFGVLPLFNDKYHEHVDDVGTPDEHFTNTDGTRGFGDVAVGARYVLLVKANDLLVGARPPGFPPGRTSCSTAEGAINEPTIQPGTGSYDGLLTALLRAPSVPVTAQSGSSRALKESTGATHSSTGSGMKPVATAGMSYSASQRWVVSLQANARYAGRDDYRGEGVPSTGSQLDLALSRRPLPLRTTGASYTATCSSPFTKTSTRRNWLRGPASSSGYRRGF